MPSYIIRFNAKNTAHYAKAIGTKKKKLLNTVNGK